MLKMIAVVAVLGIVAAACGGNNGGGGSYGSDRRAGATGADLSGGTLRMAHAELTSMLGVRSAEGVLRVTWEYYRCCLLRTLMSYNGRADRRRRHAALPGPRGRAPDVSDDGLTWTFTLKPGIHYGDPFTDVEVTAQDFIRALEREANPKANVGGYSVLLLASSRGSTTSRPARPTRSRACGRRRPARL